MEDPNYGLGLLTSLASTCAAMRFAGSSCGTFAGWNLTASAELLRSAQQRASFDGSDWDQDGCASFVSGNLPGPCDDHVYLGTPLDASYKPRDFNLSLFLASVGVTGGYQASNAYQFDSYCEPNTDWVAPYNATKLWGPNRYTFYYTYPVALYEGDILAPRVSVGYPTAGLVLTGAFTLLASTADNFAVSQVSYYGSAGGVAFATVGWPFSFPIDTSSGNVDGPVNLLARAWDVAGNSTLSAINAVTVSNPRVNSGGAAFVDPLGNHWFADYGYSGGVIATTTATINGADIETLYQKVRWNPGGFSYTLPVGNGTRTVKLRFAEFVYTTVGTRVFNVLINGTPVLTNFDVVAAGGAFNAVDRSFSVNVTNQTVTVSFVPVRDNPIICALQVN